MAEYKGSVELISGITPKAGGDFPLVEAKDVLMPDGSRLSNFSGGGGGGGSTIVVDSELSPTSTNPVQNKVVHRVTNHLQQNVDTVREYAQTVKEDAAVACSMADIAFNKTMSDIEPRLGALEKNDIIIIDDGNGNVTIDYADSERTDEEVDALEIRLGTVESRLFGFTQAGPKPEPTVETKSITNLISNPQFADGSTGWGMSGTGVDLTVTDGVLCATQVEPSTKSQSIRSKLTKDDFTIGHLYYLHAKVKYEDKIPPNARAEIIGPNYKTVIESKSPKLGVWCYTSEIEEYTATPSGSFYAGITNSYSESITDIVGAKCYVDHIMCIDLTATFGEDNEPDLATMDRWMEAQYPDGFTGTATLALTAEDNGEDDEVEVEHAAGLVGKVAVLEVKVNDLKTDVADLVEARENLPSAEVQQMGTVYPTLHDHFISNIEAAKPDYYGKQDANTLTFVMMADMHLLANNKTILPNVEASSAWAKLVNHDFVMLGGDFIIGDEPKIASLGYIDTLMEMAEKHANCPVYAVKGNHDTCEETNDTADRITDKEFYLHANARGEKYGMVTDPDNPYGGYYYVDFDRQKIRMVCLNTTEIRSGADILTATTNDFRWMGVKSVAQMSWLANTALQVPEGWAVMMVSHVPPITGANVGVTDETTSATTAAPFHNRGVRAADLTNLCEAFVRGASGSVSAKTYDGTAVGTVSVPYDFSAQGAREFIGHFCGHVHEDSQSVFNGLNYVVVNSTTPTKRWATSLDRTADADKLSLNSFIINRATRTVECIKIGAAPAEGYEWWSDSFTW